MQKLIVDKELTQKILILEDDENRILWFKEKFGYAPCLYITKQTGTALELLNNTQFDLVFLDHDLEPDHYAAFAEGREPQMELTGLYIAKNLKDTKNANTCVVIHSMNPIGASNMQAYIPQAITVPFNFLREVLTFDENK